MRSEDHRVAGGREVATFVIRPSVPADVTAKVAWTQVAGRISDASMRARALLNSHEREPDLVVALEALIVELDGAFSAAMRTEWCPTEGRTAP
jgi:hypothetical protein